MMVRDPSPAQREKVAGGAGRMRVVPEKARCCRQPGGQGPSPSSVRLRLPLSPVGDGRRIALPLRRAKCHACTRAEDRALAVPMGIPEVSAPVQRGIAGGPFLDGTGDLLA